MRGWLTRHADAVLAAGVALAFVAEVSFEAGVHRREPAALAALAFAASLLVRRRFPLVPLLAGLAVIELDNTVIKGLAEAGGRRGAHPRGDPAGGDRARPAGQLR
jgi:hypothetical protein